MRAVGLISCLFSVAILAQAVAEPVRIVASWPALIDAGGMRQRIDTPRLRIIDLRDAAAYAEGHADGAVSVPMEAWTEAARLNGLAKLIGDAGIHPARPLLLIHEDSATDAFVDAGWLAWELRRRGVASVTILEGGWDAWEEAGLRTTLRVHRHRTYDMAFDVTDLAASSQNEAAGIRLGVAAGELLEITGPEVEAYSIEGVPALSMANLIGDGDLDQLDLLEGMKSVPVSWQSERVVVFSEDPRLAAAFWFLASEILGISGIAVMPAASGGTTIAGLAE